MISDSDMKTCSADYLLIRHIRPQIAPGICYGKSDLPVAEAADPACHLLASHFFSASSRNLLLSSPLIRARKLADTLAGASFDNNDISKTRIVDSHKDWQEIDFGQWEGMPWDNIPSEAIDLWQQNPESFSPPGGESAQEMAERVERAWQRWCQMDQGGILVSHVGVIRMILAQVLGLSVSSQLRLEVDYQHGVWLQRSWLEQPSEDGACGKVPDSELWKVRGLNLSLQELAQRFHQA